MPALNCINIKGFNIHMCAALLLLAAPFTCPAQRAVIETRVRDPYIGAIVIDADTGMILFADNPDAKGYPASVLKTMVLLVTLEKIDAGALKLSDKAQVTAESARMGGSQVYLKEHETFTVEELLYALMIQSANDAATALAIHIAGSKDGFVTLMNQRAQSLGMQDTVFHSMHGLPPAAGQQPDISSARDLARMARAALAHPETLRYTSVTERAFRETPPFIMRSHNNLLNAYEGCDGLKTGYFRQAGYSIIATAKRGDTRLIAIILGAPDKTSRDRKAAELLTAGFMKIPKKEKPAPRQQPESDAAPMPDAGETCPSCSTSLIIPGGLALAIGIVIVLVLIKARRRKSMR